MPNFCDPGPGYLPKFPPIEFPLYIKIFTLSTGLEIDTGLSHSFGIIFEIIAHRRNFTILTPRRQDAKKDRFKILAGYADTTGNAKMIF
jgi:hypothetical protein